MSDFQKYLDENLGKICIQCDEIQADSDPVYDIYLEVRDSIITLRRKRHMTQKELAAKTGLTQANICRLEKGISKPSIDTLKRIAEATGTRLIIEFAEQEAM